MIRLISTLVIFCSIAAASCGSTNNKNDSEEMAEEENEKMFKDEQLEEDWEFLVKAASGGLMEVQLGNLAQQNSTSEKVKEFAATMVKDYTQYNEELKELAQKKNVSIPRVPGEKHARQILSLTNLKGPAFDIEYLKIIEKDHEEILEKYSKEALTGQEPEIKAFASGKVNALKQHYDMVRALHQTIEEK